MKCQKLDGRNVTLLLLLLLLLLLFTSSGEVRSSNIKNENIFQAGAEAAYRQG